jgi:DHA2 family multidrug resistance protein
MIGTFMSVLDSTIVNVGLPKMMAIFGTSVDKIEWVLTAYMLIFAVVLPMSGWVADHFGYKRTYFMGMALFTVGSFLCSLSWNENALIVFRIVQGAGAGFLMPVGLAIVTREFPPERRGIAVGFWGIAAAASVSLGPLVGGFLIDNFSWHAIFDVNIPVGIVGLFAIWLIQREHRTKVTRAFDYVGFFSMAGFLVPLLLGLADGNAAWNTGGWTSNFILSCFAISAVSFIVFIVTEITVEHPILDLRLLLIRNFGISNIMFFFFGMVLFGNAFLIPLYLQNSLDFTPTQSGMVFLPLGVVQALTSPLSGYISDNYSKKIPVALGVFIVAVSFYLFHFLSLTTEHAQFMIPMYMRGLGIGLLFTPLSSIALMDIPRDKMAQASGLFNTVRQVGGSFGVAILGSLLVRRNNFHTQVFSQAVNVRSEVYQHTVGMAKYYIKDATGAVGSNAILQAKSLIARNLAAQAFVQSINDDFFIGATLAIILLIPLLLLKTRKIGSSEKVEIID